MKDIKGALKRIWRQSTHRPKYRREEFGSIGPHSLIGEGCTLVPRNMYLDDYVIIQNGVNFVSSEGKLVVKRFSVISTECIIIPGTHRAVAGIPFFYQAVQHLGDEHRTIIIEEDCWIGAGCILLMKCHVGRGAIVAAGSVVTKPVPPYAVVAGNPARIIGVKFSKSDIIKHEEAIYEPSDRLSVADIDSLFKKYYADITPIA